MNSFEIKIPETKQSLVFANKALRTFCDARQIAPKDKETGGILFAKISHGAVQIVEATKAEKSASKSRNMFMPSLKQKRIAVKKAFKEGLHFVGEWHTHPECSPKPSSLDLHSMEDSFKRSKHELSRFIMVIVGNCEEFLSLSITLHSNQDVLKLGLFRLDPKCLDENSSYE
ncbi:MAG: Mov34/MPN/PAD-1 family protein [Opitutales bacterium]|nr:Mov34/MPN/PAD-1 family protein [Opitutales bacterium]